MSPIRHVNNDSELETMINNLGVDRCSIVYFFLPWCGSCQKMNPFVESMADKNPNVLFLKVDAERSQTSSKKHRITKVPIFLLYNNRIKVDRVEGASPMELETKIRRIQADLDAKRGGTLLSTTPNHGQDFGQNGHNGQNQAYNQYQNPGPNQGPNVPRMGDVSEYFDRKNCRVINDLVPSSLQEFLEGNKLVSGKGVGKLLLMYSFTEKMVIQSFKVKAPTHTGPRILRFFTNVGKSTDINVVNQMNAIQEVMLSEDDLAGQHVIDLRHGGFVGINALQIYIPENQTASRRIEIDHLILNGAPFSLSPFSSGAGARPPLERNQQFTDPYLRMGGISGGETHQYVGGSSGGGATSGNTTVKRH